MAQDDLKDDVARRTPGMIELRPHYHMHPERSFEEHETAASIAERLRKTGLDVTEGVGGTGVVGLLRGEAGEHGPTLMVRADIDALPITELNEVEYRSQVDGTMHACGHDGHIAIALTLAELLADRRDQWSGIVKFAFQPAEEVIGGAERMIADGVMRDPDVDAVIGLHLWTPVPVGTVSVAPGPVFSSGDGFRLRVRGRGGHGAMPHLNVDPIVAAAEIVVALQTLVSREISPFNPAVVTIGAIHGGTAFNVIADEVELQGTLRAYDPADREHLKRRLGEVASHVAEGLRASVRVQCRDRLRRLCQRYGDGRTGAPRRRGDRRRGERAGRSDQRQAASDDMSAFLAAVPGCYFFVGASNADEGHHRAAPQRPLRY